FVDGKTFEGRVSGLGPLEVRLGKEVLHLNLTSATEIQFESATPTPAVTCTVLARLGDKEVGRVSKSLTFGELVSIRLPSKEDPVAVGADIKAPLLEKEKVTRTLPAPATDAVMGGGGRFLILHLPKLRKLALFDVSAAKITGYIPLGGDD